MKLSQYLTKRNITSAAFARKVRVSLSSIQKYRAGTKMPRPDVVARIQKATSGRVKPADWYKS